MATEPTPVDLDRIEALLSKATAAPWTYRESGIDSEARAMLGMETP